MIEKCILGHYEYVKFLIEKGANIKAKNKLAIQQAAINGHLEILKFLYEKGVNIKANNNNAINQLRMDN